MASQMLHYVVEFDDGSRFDVHVDPDDPTNISVDGVDSDINVTPSAQGLLVSSSGGQRFPVALRYEDGELVAETSDGKHHRARIELAESREWRNVVASQPPPPPLEHSGRVDARIAGNIVALLVAEGSNVVAGTPILMMEAMKMQNTVEAPTVGIIRFAVSAGQTVRTGDLLATIESRSA
jgi:biotin carboxyl carrier protein